MHKEYIRVAENADIAVLFIHGIVGTPNHFKAFLPKVPESMSVYNMLLDGHGKGVRDFSKTSMEAWEGQVSGVVKQLAQHHREIYIVGHSMGTLLAIGQALREPKITKLFLLAVPLRIALKPAMFFNTTKVYLGKIRPDDRQALAARDAYGIGEDKNPFHYLGWIPRYLELFRKARQIRGLVSALEIPCFVYQSEKDELVSLQSLSYMEKRPNIQIRHLPNSGHYYYTEEDFALLLDDFETFLQ